MASAVQLATHRQAGKSGNGDQGRGIGLAVDTKWASSDTAAVARKRRCALGRCPMAKKRQKQTVRDVKAPPKRKTYAERKPSAVKTVVIKPRRKVETSDALIFPSGRPIRKR